VLVAVSKGTRAVKLHQQNPPVLNWKCRLTQVDLCNGRKTVVAVVVVVLSQQNKLEYKLNTYFFCAAFTFGYFYSKYLYHFMYTNTVAPEKIYPS